SWPASWKRWSSTQRRTALFGDKMQAVKGIAGAAAGEQPPVSRGVRPLNERARKLERRITLATVLLPYVGLAGGIALFWRRGVSPLDLAVLAFMYCLTVLGIGMGFHRLIAHRAYQATPFLKTALIISGSMAMP